MDDPRPQDETPLESHQDGFRRVYFGPVADPLVPPPAEELPTDEDELTRAALEDPAAHHLGLPEDSKPTLWRLIVLVLFAVAALGIVFLRR